MTPIVSENEVDDQRFLVVAIVAGEAIVGSCLLIAWQTDHPTITHLHVRPESRRLGAGAALVRACVVRCEAAGKASCSLSVRRDNEPARRLYRREGFREFAGDDKNIWMGRPLG